MGDNVKGQHPKRPRRFGHSGEERNYKAKLWKSLCENSHTIFTSILCLLLLVLLFGIVSQLKPPVMSSTPSGVTSIDYSTLVQQIKAGNVKAVTIRGDEVNGLLVWPLSQSTSTDTRALPTSSKVRSPHQNASQEYSVWLRYVSGNGASWANASLPVEAARSVYTHTPAGEESHLLSLLRSAHIAITTLPINQVPVWLTTIWKFFPIVVVVILLLVFLSSRGNTRVVRNIDDRVSQVGKSRARRFIRAKEVDAKTTPNVSKTSSLEKSPSSTTATGQTGQAKQRRATANPAGSIASASSHLVVESSVTFADVAGIDEVRAELEEIVHFLRSPEKFNRLGARIPRGALLVGPPGTGKTLLAKAVAGEAHVPFFSISASEFVEMFVGVGASRVRDLFNQARQVAPSVIFIDEIDAVGRKRSMRMTGSDERDQTLNQLLVELDGFDTRQAVVVMAATNRVDILDKAMLRPGRFDRCITVSMPARKGREAILAVHTRNTPLHEDVNLERLSRLTTGMSGADLANLVNEAALCAARRNLDYVTHDCFEDALARVQLGALRPLIMSEKERRIIAYHEGGHALVAHYLPESDTVNRVTILPRGQSLGVTQFTAQEDRYNCSRHNLMTRIAVGLGGRVAEELTFGPDYITTGAENDLQVVTDLARKMVTRWGMSEEVGVVFADYQAGGDYALNMQRIDSDAVSSKPLDARSLVLDEDGNFSLHGSEMPICRYEFTLASPSARSASSASMNALIDTEVQRILNEGRIMARALLTEHRDQLELLATALMEYEQLDRMQFEALLGDA